MENLIYQPASKFWKNQSILRIVSISPESIIAKIGELKNSVVRFHLEYKSVHDPAWRQVKAMRGLIGAAGICIFFGDIVMVLGYSSVNSCVGYTSLVFAPGFLKLHPRRFKFWQDIIIGNLRLSALS